MAEQIDVSVYGTPRLANNYGMEPLVVATAELQQTLNDAFGERDHDPTLSSYDVRVNFYGYGNQHEFLVDVGTENPYKALDDWIDVVTNREVPGLGHANLLLTDAGGSGRAWSKAATAGARQLVENDANDPWGTRPSEGHVVHIEEVLHMLGFGENEGVVRTLDDGDRQVVTPLWAGGDGPDNLNDCGEPQPDIDYAGKTVEYATTVSACVREQEPRIP